MKKKHFKKAGIAVAAVLIACVLIYTVKPIYYRVYPFNRFTVDYVISYNGEEVECSDKYCLYDNGEETVRNVGKSRFKTRGGKYGDYKIGLTVRSKALYVMADCDDIFLGLEDFKFRFDYFNTNWWHITDFKIYVNFVNADGEWYADCKQVITEPDVDESGKTHTDTFEGRFLLKDINNYDSLPLSDANG